MPKELLFWILMLLWLFVWLFFEYTPGQPYPVRRIPGAFLMFVLFAVIGWKVFGPPIQ